MFSDPRSDGSYVALQLDAVSYAQTSADLGLPFDGSTPLSVDAYVRFNGLAANTSVIGKSAAFAFGSMANTIYFQFAGFPIVQSDPTVTQLRDNSWHYICATFDGGQIRLYIDGTFNVLQGITGTGTTNANAIQFGNGLQGLIRFVRVYNTVLNADAVRANMYGSPKATEIVANFDFSQVPPFDRGPRAFPITLQNNATMIKVSPALSLPTSGFARPFFDEIEVNPGGAQVDPYTVQSWVYVSSTANLQQAIFVNSDLESDTGIALLLQYESAAGAFRAVSKRGSNISAHLLTSTGVVPLNTWVNVATTFDGTKLSLYLNGALDSTKPCPPIALYHNSSDLLIGAALSHGQPSGASTLQGYMREVDVWKRALTAAEITTYMSTSPDVTDPDLAGAYVFTTSPARNQANGHPIGLAEGAVLGGQLGPAVQGERPFEPPQRPIDEAVLARFRQSVDFARELAANADVIAAAKAADVAAFTDPAERARIAAIWDDVIERARREPLSLPFTVTTHVHEGEHLLVCHTPQRSYVAFRVDAATVSECDMWQVSLVLVLAAGALDAFTGVPATATARAIPYILLRVLVIPEVLAVLARGAPLGASGVFDLLAKFVHYGLLRELLLLIIEVGFWVVIRVVARMLLVFSGFGSVAVVGSLIATAIQYIVKYNSKPASCASLPDIDVAAISFNYDATSVRAKFTIKAPTTETVQVRANNGGILGAIDPVTVTFSGTFATVVLNLTHQTLASGGVHVQDVQWNWQYQIGSSGWLDMTTTKHRIYVLLDTPTGPWVQDSNPSNQQLPWTDVLDQSCVWANGATTLDAAAAAVTQKVNSGLGLDYDTAGGGDTHYTTKTGLLQFMCTQFLAFIKGTGGNGKYVNCTDCALSRPSPTCSAAMLLPRACGRPRAPPASCATRSRRSAALAGTIRSPPAMGFHITKWRGPRAAPSSIPSTTPA
jgi:hypothetical protein